MGYVTRVCGGACDGADIGVCSCSVLTRCTLCITPHTVWNDFEGAADPVADPVAAAGGEQPAPALSGSSVPAVNAAASGAAPSAASADDGRKPPETAAAAAPPVPPRSAVHLRSTSDPEGAAAAPPSWMHRMDATAPSRPQIAVPDGRGFSSQPSPLRTNMQAATVWVDFEPQPEEEGGAPAGPGAVTTSPIVLGHKRGASAGTPSPGAADPHVAVKWVPSFKGTRATPSKAEYAAARADAGSARKPAAASPDYELALQLSAVRASGAAGSSPTALSRYELALKQNATAAGGNGSPHSGSLPGTRARSLSNQERQTPEAAQKQKSPQKGAFSSERGARGGAPPQQQLGDVGTIGVLRL